MTTIERFINLDEDEYGREGDLEDVEQDLEYEANRLMNSWNRSDLLREIEEEKQQMAEANNNQPIDYYDGLTPFEDLFPDMDKLFDGRLYMKIIEPNTYGKEIKATSTILYDQIGYTELEGRPFDSSTHEGKPTKLSLMEGPTLPGLLMAFTSMREGERANVIIHPSLAYGRLGCTPWVPPNSYVFYNLKIYRVWDESLLNGVIEYERSYFVQVPIEEKLGFIREHKDKANNFMKDDMPRDALIRYKAAIKFLDELPPSEVERSDELSKLKVTLLTNATIALNKLGMHKTATRTAKRALCGDPQNIKAYYHLAKARMGLSDHLGALRWIEEGSKKAQDDSLFNQLRLQLDFQLRDEKKKRDEIMMKMAKACIQ